MIDEPAAGDDCRMSWKGWMVVAVCGLVLCCSLHGGYIHGVLERFCYVAFFSATYRAIYHALPLFPDFGEPRLFDAACVVSAKKNLCTALGL